MNNFYNGDPGDEQMEKCKDCDHLMDWHEYSVDGRVRYCKCPGCLCEAFDSSIDPPTEKTEYIDAINRAINLECDGCAYDDEGFIQISPDCALHGDGLAAKKGLNRLIAERDEALRKAKLYKKSWHTTRDVLDETEYRLERIQKEFPERQEGVQKQTRINKNGIE